MTWENHLNKKREQQVIYCPHIFCRFIRETLFWSTPPYLWQNRSIYIWLKKFNYLANFSLFESYEIPTSLNTNRQRLLIKSNSWFHNCSTTLIRPKMVTGQSEVFYNNEPLTAPCWLKLCFFCSAGIMRISVFRLYKIKT